MSRRKTHEEFVAEVKALVGNEYTVVGMYKTNKIHINIHHQECGEIYPVVPTNFLRGRRCPKCFGNRKKTTEEFNQEVFSLVGKEYVVIGEYENSRTRIEVLHRKCSEIYLVRPNDFICGSRCPKCVESKGEREVADWLRRHTVPFNTQVPIRYDKTKQPLFLDVFAQGVAIEYDGEYHYEQKPHAGGEEGLRHRQHLDRIKDKYCADNGIPLIRIPYWDFDNIDAILTEKLLPLLELDASSTQKQAS